VREHTTKHQPFNSIQYICERLNNFEEKKKRKRQDKTFVSLNSSFFLSLYKQIQLKLTSIFIIHR